MGGSRDSRPASPGAERGPTGPSGVPGPAEPQILIEDGPNRRPFMRGIMIHSLMARGVSFDEAYRTATGVRDRLRGRPVVPRSELANAVSDILGRVLEPEPTLPVPADIVITGRGRGLPFSKGVLSQSLLAAAIDPNDAFDVAREIERNLIGRGVREIDRHDLRKIAYETLTQQLGAQTAERYLVWRRYQDPERPVIIMLGGAAGVGKTSLALEVAHRLGIGRMLSTDSIRQIMRLMLSRDLFPAIHGSSYDGQTLLPGEPGELEPAEAVIAGFRAQTAAVSVGIRASLDRAVDENASLVMDGVAIVPGLIDLHAYDETADVIFLLVAVLDREDFVNRFASRAADQKRRPPHRYVENLDAILQIQNHLLELADHHGIPIVDNASFDRTVLLIIRHVAETLRKRGDFDASELL